MPDLVTPHTLTDKMIREYRDSVVRDPGRRSTEVDAIARNCEYAALEHLARWLSPGIVADCRQRICDAINASKNLARDLAPVVTDDRKETS